MNLEPGNNLTTIVTGFFALLGGLLGFLRNSKTRRLRREAEQSDPPCPDASDPDASDPNVTDHDLPSHKPPHRPGDNPRTNRR